MRRQDTVTLFLCGDVMTGRGIDQVLPHPSDPVLYEEYVRSADGYVRLAEKANGPIPRRARFEYVWGDALSELEHAQPDLRIVNLETSITAGGTPFPKGINYRMNPKNVPVLATAGIDCCVLSNNHVLDWGRNALVETLETLEQAGIRHVGAGRDLPSARAPAALELSAGGRVVVFGCATPSAGVPAEWAAGRRRGGVNVLESLSERTITEIARSVAATKRRGDVAMVSIHWGGNWGYDIPPEQRHWAHMLIEHAGIDLIHGHSSHHAKGIEVHQGKLIIYGCGDFITDYEGIPGHEAYRGDLAVMYLPTMDRRSGRLVRLRMVPFRIRRFRLDRAGPQDTNWLQDVLGREGAALGTAVEVTDRREMFLRWS